MRFWNKYEKKLLALSVIYYLMVFSILPYISSFQTNPIVGSCLIVSCFYPIGKFLNLFVSYLGRKGSRSYLILNFYSNNFMTMIIFIAVVITIGEIGGVM